jgi:hypothetical protein
MKNKISLLITCIFAIIVIGHQFFYALHNHTYKTVIRYYDREEIFALIDYNSKMFSNTCSNNGKYSMTLNPRIGNSVELSIIASSELEAKLCNNEIVSKISLYDKSLEKNLSANGETLIPLYKTDLLKREVSAIISLLLILLFFKTCDV